jgi:hypothetical protein
MLAPWGAERISFLSFLALPPAAWPARFLPAAAGYLGWSAVVPYTVALASRAAKRKWLAAGLAFGWSGVLLHAALWRTVDLPWMYGVFMPFWLLANAVACWLAGRGLLAREPLR